MPPTGGETGTVAIYKRLLGTSVQYWPVFLAASLAMAMYAACDTGFAYVIKLLTGVVAAGEDLSPREQFIAQWLPAAVIIVFIVRGATGFLSAYGLAWIGRQAIKNLRAQVFEKFLRLPTA